MPNNQSLQQFYEQYCNWNSLSTVCMTADIDFAPDYMIAHLLQIFERHDVGVTFFATHDSALLRQIEHRPEFELGIHPNLSTGSTQGTQTEQILTCLRKMFPSAFGCRFHLLHYSYRHLAELKKRNFKYDVSTLRFNCPYLVPAWHGDVGMTLLTYCWEDGVCENASRPMELKSIDLTAPGMKIINFHPMNVYLNGSDSVTRLEFLRDHPDLLNCPEKTAARYRRKGSGAEKVLEDLLTHLSLIKCHTPKLSEMTVAFEKAYAADTREL